MREIDFYLDRQNGVVVQGLNTTAQLTSISIFRNDTLQLVLHSAEKNTAIPPLTKYVETPLSFNSARVSIGLVDAPPVSGRFAFQVGGETTAQLTWPEDLSTPALVTAWKTTMLDALLALSNVGNYNGANGGTAGPALIQTDPEGAPAHFNFYAWADPTRTDPITVANNTLLPLCLPKPIPSQLPDGYTQLIRFRQAPVAMCTAFTNPLPPPCTLAESVHGATGINEEQVLTVPEDAAGAVAFAWGGANTISLDVATITAAAIAAALNAIVADGSTNPSFTVTEVTAVSGQQFVIGFTGPLAGAAQALVGVIMVNQVPLPYASGTLDLSQACLMVNEELDGQPEVQLFLEIVLDTPGEETYLIQVELEADMTDPSTAGDIAASGGVITITDTVYVNDANPTPIIQAAPGIVSAPTSPGQSFNFVHNLNTWQPFVRVSRQLTATPEVWEQVDDTEFVAESTDPNSVTVTFVNWTLNNTAGDPFNFANFKIFIWSPNTELLMFNLLLTWDQVLASIPNGESVRQKFASLDAALGILGGNLTIPASDITGLIKPSQIDLNALGTALANVSTFLSTLTQLAANSQFLTSLFNSAVTNPAFLSALTSIFTAAASSSSSSSSNSAAYTALLNALMSALLSSSIFSTAISTAVTNALQDGSQLPSGVTTLFNIPNVTDLYPSPRTGGSSASTGSSGSTAGPVPLIYAPLPVAVIVPIDKGTINGDLPLASFENANWKYLVQGSATARTMGQRRGLVFPDGAVIVSDGRQWYAATLDSGTYYPAIMTRELFTLAIRAEQLWPGTRFAVNFGVSLGLAGATGEYLLRIRTGVAAQTAGGGANLSQVTWDAPVIEERIILTEVPTIHSFGYAVVCAAGGGAISATKSLYGQTSAAAAPSGGANFVLRASLECFSVQNCPNANGAVSLAMTNALGSIVEAT